MVLSQVDMNEAVDTLSGALDGSATAVTLTRGLAILEAIAASHSSNGVTHAAIAMRLGMSRSTLYRYLAVLQATGFLEADPDTHRYRLGARVQVLAATASREAAFAQRALEFSRRASLATGEQSQAMVLSRGEAVTIAVAPVARTFGSIGDRTRVGAVDPVHASGCGKLFLAFAGERIPAEYFDSELDAHTETTVTDPDVLLDELDQIRRQGYAVDRAEHYDGITCVAVPVFDAPDRIAGALAVVLDRGRIEPTVAASIADKLMPIGRRFSHDLSEIAAFRGPLIAPS